RWPDPRRTRRRPRRLGLGLRAERGHLGARDHPVGARAGDPDPSLMGMISGASAVAADMQIDIWSDIACPWCYIGKRRLERALADYPHRDEVEVTWHSYQLDPALPEHYDGTEVEYLSSRKGMPAEQVRQMFAHVSEQAA